VRRKGDVAAWPAFEDGVWWVQDAAAAIPARLLNLKPGETALDLCAAPGGKTMQLVAAGAQVVAVDRSPPASPRHREPGAHQPAPPRSSPPTPGPGTTRGPSTPCCWTPPARPPAPSAAIRTCCGPPAPATWPAWPACRAKLLDSAAGRLKPGGRLVYCVCSLEPEEGEAQVEAFLARRKDMALDPIAAGEGGSPAASLTPRGTLRILPHHREGGLDGFFAARFKKLLFDGGLTA
jgi:16S rRNA (cytosine967-C5)-methyltransferase